MIIGILLGLVFGFSAGAGINNIMLRKYVAKIRAYEMEMGLKRNYDDDNWEEV